MRLVSFSAAASALGALLLVLAVVVGAANLYYRPTIERAYVDGRAITLSPLTTNVITATAVTLLAGAGIVSLWLGTRWRRR